LPFIEKDIIFGFIADERAEVFANDAVPIGAVLLIELLLDMLGHEVLSFEGIDCVLGLSGCKATSFIASAIMSELSGMSMMFSFLMVSGICNLNYMDYDIIGLD
jgi:uncharacterized membrane protein YecN with MAPEG domain